MQKLKPQLKKETWKERLKFHWNGLRFLVYMAEIIVPGVIGRTCGHALGAIAAVVNIIVWIYFGVKSHMSPGTMMLWLFGVVYVVIVAVLEFAHFFHWQITSNGHF